jgi:MFS transporter, OFA family, oxalate/formate antiporter
LTNPPHTAGFYGWRLVAALWCIQATVVGCCFYGPPILFPYMIEELGWGRSEISLGFMVSIIVMGLSSPFAAWGVGRFGARLTIFTGGLIGALGLYLTHYSNSVTMYVIFFGGFSALGISLSVMIPVQTVITFWFNQRRGTALGIVISGGAIGGLVSPMILTYIVESTNGNWRMGWISLSLAMLVSAAIGVIFVRNKPSDLGQHPDGVDPDSIAPDNIDPANKALTKSTSTKAPIHRTSVNWKISDVIRTSQFWSLITAMVGTVFIWQLIITQSPLHLADRGFTSAQYSLIYGITIGLTVIGCLGGGYLVDRMEPRILFLGAIVLTLIGAILFWFVTPDNLLTLSYPLFSAIALGTVTILIPSIISNYWGTMAFARVNAVLLPCTTLLNSLSAPIAGAIYDHTGSYFYALLLCWTLIVIAFFAMLKLKPPQPKQSAQ